jgi:hypothetical protein
MCEILEDFEADEAEDLVDLFEQGLRDDEDHYNGN